MHSGESDNWPGLALQLAREQGFALAGVCAAQPTDHQDYFRGWLAEGRHGEMHYLAENVGIRLDPRKLLPGARSILCVADRYGSDPQPQACSLKPVASPPQPPSGAIARYATGPDYHRVIKARLFRIADALRQRFPSKQFRAAVDTAPLMERQHAARAGLGWIAKNTLLINPRLGSYLLLGEIVTTLPSPEPSARSPQPAASHCGTCTRCMDACPTQCLTPYQLDARRCISYLTLEHRSVIAPHLHAPMGNWFAGCDVCQQVCPFNQRPTRNASSLQPAASSLKPPAPSSPRPPASSLLDVLSWDVAARRRAFRASALKRLKLDMARRNALIVAGNYLAANPGDPPNAVLVERIRAIATDLTEPELVRTTARQTLDRLTAQRPAEKGD